MKSFLLLLSFCLAFTTFFVGELSGQSTRFEKTSGLESATYFETIDYYKKLDQASPKILLKEMGPTDAGYHLHLVLFSADGKFDPAGWRASGKVIVLVNNGIHPGEPDGIDASMMFLRDLANGTIKAPANLVFAIIPVYNIGGCLNRGISSRANQDGPLEYGFRGNSQNLDLNRDFTKNDSREAGSFAAIFHWLDPDILIDNHVSDGADYQHTITMLTTQYDKLGKTLGKWLKADFEPTLFTGMSKKGWDMFPYVNFETASPAQGMEQFYDPPRYSSGYAALWQCIAFVPETHMLKPYRERVKSTYAFMQTVMEEASKKSTALKAAKLAEIKAVSQATSFPLGWLVDTSLFSYVNFKGYEQAFKTSEATGLQQMYYDHQRPFNQQVKFFNSFAPQKLVAVPRFYVIPRGWQAVIDILKKNDVVMQVLQRDTTLAVEAYHIDDYKAAPRAYEKHHRNADVKVSVMKQSLRFLKGDYLVPTQQRAVRYLMEMLEPTGDDSFFAWNFFDAVLQQKEGYSDYRWDEVAASVLKKDPALQTSLNELKKMDTAFATSAAAQLNWIYKHSIYYEPGHMRYPVYRIPVTK